MGEPDVKVRKSASKTSVVAGDSFDYTLVAENVGTVDATNVKTSEVDVAMTCRYEGR